MPTDLAPAVLGPSRPAQQGRGPARLVASLLVLTFAAYGALTATTQTHSHALTASILAPVAAALPTSIATGASATLTGVGAVSYFGGTSAAVGSGVAVGGATAAGVALAPVAVAAAAALVAGGALYLGWKWASGSSAGTSYDPPATSGAVAPGTTMSPVSPYVVCPSSPLAFCSSGGSMRGELVTGPARGVMSGTYQLLKGSSGTFSLTTVAVDGATCNFIGNVPSSVTTTVSFACPAGSGGVASANMSPGALWSFGTAGAPAGPSGSTSVSSVPTSQCSGGSSVPGAAVTFTGATDPASLPLILAPACPAGQTRTGFTMPSKYPDGTTAPSPIPGFSAPTIPSTYAECQSPKSCVLTLTRTAPDGSVANCTNTGVCTGYAGEPGPDAQGNTYNCKWGPYTMPASDCTTVPTLPAPGTGTGTTTADPFPTTGPNPQPSAGPSGAPAPAPNLNPDTDTEGCLAANWSWNPVSWVYAPVKCALQWAFVPKADTVTDLKASASTLTTTSVPFVYFTAGADAVDDLSNPGSQCFTINVSRGDGNVKALSTCDPGPAEAWLMNNRGLMTAALYAGFLLPMLWWAWRQYAPGATGVA